MDWRDESMMRADLVCDCGRRKPCRHCTADDIVTRLRLMAGQVPGITYHDLPPASTLADAADEIERLRAENEALLIAGHDSMWNDTLIPIAEAIGVKLADEHGVPRRQFQMVEAIVKEARRG